VEIFALFFNYFAIQFFFWNVLAPPFLKTTFEEFEDSMGAVLLPDTGSTMW